MISHDSPQITSHSTLLKMLSATSLSDFNQLPPSTRMALAKLFCQLPYSPSLIPQYHTSIFQLQYVKISKKNLVFLGTRPTTYTLSMRLFIKPYQMQIPASPSPSEMIRKANLQLTLSYLMPASTLHSSLHFPPRVHIFLFDGLPTIVNIPSVAPFYKKREHCEFMRFRSFLKSYRYLITNYEHNNFTIAQSRFDARAKAEIMALPSGDVTPTPGRHSTNRKIVIGAAVGSSTFAVCLFLILFFIIRKRLGSWRAKPRKSSSLSESFHRWLPNDAKLVNEIGFNSLYNPRAELYDTGKVEIQGSVMPPGTSDTARESSSFLSRTVRSKRTSKDLLKVPELRVNTVPITGARKIKARNRHGGHQSSQEVYTKRRRHSSIHDAKPLPLVPFPRQETLKSVLPSSGKARQQLAPYNRHAKSTVEQDSTAHRSAHDSQTLSFEKSTQLQMPPDLDSCLTVSRAPSASSTYANIIDYDYYRHGTPAQEIEEKPA